MADANRFHGQDSQEGFNVSEEEFDFFSAREEEDEAAERELAWAEAEAEAWASQYDDDPNPYHGDYFEDDGW